jgi:DNA-binding NtrC family response regulator
VPNSREVLVVSSDEEVLRRVGEIIALSAWEAVLSGTVAEGKVALARHPVSVVVSDDQLVDGGYRDVVEAVKQTPSDAPVIVVSRVGAWRECLEAFMAGAFDYIRFPVYRGELERAIGNALNERERQMQLEAGKARHTTFRTGQTPMTPGE